MQLNKYLAHAGITSRRKAADLIKQGNVTVNKQVITQPGYHVKPNDVVAVNGKIIFQEPFIYIILNKPRDYITTVRDERGRRTVLDLLKPAIKTRVYPVGRLDRDTTGVLLLTNDGDLTHKLAHPRHIIEKIYYVVLDITLKSSDAQRLQEGVRLEDGRVQVDDISYIPGKPRNHLFIIIHSGKNRVIRRMFEALNYRVKSLDRTSFAGLTKQRIRIGTWRFLTKEEVALLKGGKKGVS